MDWDLWLDIWSRHARTDRYKRQLDRAVAFARAGGEEMRMYCSNSGGKDSVAMCSVLHDAGARVKMAHAHTELNTPGMLECAERTAEIFGCEIDIVEPDLDEHETIWDFLMAMPRAESVMSPKGYGRFAKRVAAGNMLVAYGYASGYRGTFCGMRAGESRGRLINRMVRGSLYQSTVDNTWMCLPIVDWSARDVFATAVARGLPICDHYRLLHERFGVDPESPASRVDCLLTGDGIAALGSLAHVRALYPAIWSRLRHVRPEVSQYA